MTISIKIKKEDKAVMISGIRRMVEIIEAIDYKVENICTRAILLEIRAKLLAVARDDKAIRLTLVQAVYFLKYLEIYAGYGFFEMSNAGLIKAEIEKKIKEKYINT